MVQQKEDNIGNHALTPNIQDLTLCKQTTIARESPSAIKTADANSVQGIPIHKWICTQGYNHHSGRRNDPKHHLK
jgi:hypothetical protein